MREYPYIDKIYSTMLCEYQYLIYYMLDGKVQYEPYTDYNKASERLEEIKNKGVKTRKQERYTTLLEKIDGIIVAIDVLENLKPSLIELLNEVRNEQ